MRQGKSAPHRNANTTREKTKKSTCWHKIIRYIRGQATAQELNVLRSGNAPLHESISRVAYLEHDHE